MELIILAVDSLIAEYEAHTGYGYRQTSDVGGFLSELVAVETSFDELTGSHDPVFGGDTYAVFQAIFIGRHMVSGAESELVVQPSFQVLDPLRNRVKRSLDVRVVQGSEATLEPVRFTAANSQWIGRRAIDSSNRSPTNRSREKLVRFRELLDEITILPQQSVSE